MGTRTGKYPRIQSTIVLGLVRDLGPFSPYHFSSCCDKSQFTDIDFNLVAIFNQLQCARAERLRLTIVPFVKTPSCVYIGFCGFFFTPSIGNCTVTPSSG